jgi:hypothetical protein
MLGRLLSITALAATLSVAPSRTAAAQGAQPAKPKGTERTVTGTVIDVSCKFGQGLAGTDHRMCAQVCADKGIPLAILGSDGHLYVPTSAAMPGDGQNARLKEFAEQEVTVTGTVFSAAGASAIQIASIRRKS